MNRNILIEIAYTNKIYNPKVNRISSKYIDKSYCCINYPNIIKTNGFNGYSKQYSNIDTSNYHYDVNNDGKVDNQDLQALQEYFNK